MNEVDIGRDLQNSLRIAPSNLQTQTMRRNYNNTDLDPYSRGIAQEYPIVNLNYDEDDDEVPMFEPDDEDDDDDDSSYDSGDDYMLDTAEGCLDNFKTLEVQYAASE